MLAVVVRVSASSVMTARCFSTMRGTSCSIFRFLCGSGKLLHRRIYSCRRYNDHVQRLCSARRIPGIPVARSSDSPAAGRGWIAGLDLPPNEAFDALCALSAKDKQALFGWCVAQSIRRQMASDADVNPVIEQIGHCLNIDFAKFFPPSGENYWGRIPMGEAREVGEVTLGPQ